MESFFKLTLGLLVISLLVILPSINISGYVQSTISSKLIVFVFGSSLILLIFVTKLMFINLRQVLISKLDIFLLLLVVYIIINRYVIQENYGFSMRYMELLGLGLLYVVLRTLSKKNFIWIFLAITISGILQAVYGNMQLLGYYPSNHSGFKITGSYFNPGPYAGFLASVFPVAMGIYLFKEQIIEKTCVSVSSNIKIPNKLLNFIFEYVPLAAIFSIIIVLPAIRSRGAWLSVVFGSLLLFEMRYHYIRKVLMTLNLLKKALLIASVVVIIGIGFFGIYHSKKSSADGRLFIWNVTTEMIKDTPVFGVGFDRFKAHYMNYQAAYFAKHGETYEALVADNSYYTFNDWLQFIAENGLIGLLLLIFVLHTFFKIKGTHQNKFLLLIVKSTILSIGIFAFVSYPVQILPVKLILVTMLAMLGNLDKQRFAIISSTSQKTFSAFRRWKVLVIAMTMMAILMIYPRLLAINKGFKIWETALTTYQFGDYKSSIKACKEAYPILKNDGDFLMNYGKALSMDKKNNEAIEILEQAKKYLNTTIIETALGDAYKRTKQYDKAEMAYRQAANMIPVRFYPLYLLAKLYKESGDKDKALAMANTILTKDVKVPSTAIREIKAEMKMIIDSQK